MLLEVEETGDGAVDLEKGVLKGLARRLENVGLDLKGEDRIVEVDVPD